MPRDMARALAVFVLMAAASLLAYFMTPRTFLADQEHRLRLADLVPQRFGDWAVDKSILPIPPSPELQQVLDQTYDDLLSVTYRDSRGQSVMVSMAYGRNQHKGMNTHRPEVCYPAQGFKLLQQGAPASIAVGNRSIPATRVVAGMGGRIEPITYWLLVGDTVTHFGYPHRWIAIQYGLKGLIPDGVLVRISSIDRNSDAAFDLHAKFIQEMLAAIPKQRLGQLVGSHP